MEAPPEQSIADILLVSLDHGSWEAYLREHLSESELSETDIVYYESRHPSDTFGEDVDGFTESEVSKLLTLMVAMLIYLQVPQYADLDYLFVGFGSAYRLNKFDKPEHMLGSCGLTILYKMSAAKGSMEFTHKEGRGDECHFNEIWNLMPTVEQIQEMRIDLEKEKELTPHDWELVEIGMVTFNKIKPSS